MTNLAHSISHWKDKGKKFTRGKRQSKFRKPIFWSGKHEPTNQPI